jgi:hypothetical protein
MARRFILAAGLLMKPFRIFQSLRLSRGIRLPDLVTAVVEADLEGMWKVMFVGEGSLPSDSTSYLDMDELVAAVNEEVLERYRAAVGDRTMGFQYAWYPWGDDDESLGLPAARKDFLVFEIRQAASGYDAYIASDPNFRVSTGRLAALPEALRAEVEVRWPTLAGHAVPGMLHWNRNLTVAGFSDISEP